MATIILTLLAAGSAALHIRAEYRGPRNQVYVFKPLTMVFILLLALLNAREHCTFYAYAVVAGLLCSMVGDVFLMLPSDRFVAGLISFLTAHLLYIAAFTYGSAFRCSIWSLLPYAFYAILMFVILSPHLGAMKLPVLAYIVVILVMGWQAWERWSAVSERSALLAVFGAILFIVSDSVLAIDRFRGHFGFARALNLGTYFAAQWLIALSV